MVSLTGTATCQFSAVSNSEVRISASIKRSHVPGTKKLVIVESPAKAKTIAQDLGDGYDLYGTTFGVSDAKLAFTIVGIVLPSLAVLLLLLMILVSR